MDENGSVERLQEIVQAVKATRIFVPVRSCGAEMRTSGRAAKGGDLYGRKALRSPNERDRPDAHDRRSVCFGRGCVFSREAKGPLIQCLTNYVPRLRWQQMQDIRHAWGADMLREMVSGFFGSTCYRFMRPPILFWSSADLVKFDSVS